MPLGLESVLMGDSLSVQRVVGRLLASFLAVLVAMPVAADDAEKKAAKQPPAASKAPMKVRALRLSLRDVALLAFRNNPAIRRSRLDPVVAEGDLRAAKAEFDPALFGSIKQTHEESSTAGTSGGSSLFSFFGSGTAGTKTVTDTNLFELGFRKRVRTGGTIELVYTAQRTETDDGSGGGGLASFLSTPVLSPSWTNRIELRLTQPLLQGFGVEFNMTTIRIAELSRKIAHLTVEDTVRKTVSESLQTYWDLALAIRDKGIQTSSLDRAQSLLKLNQERLKRGLVSRLDVLRAQVGVAQRRERIIRINQQMLDVEDRLKKLILPQDDVFFRQVTILPTEALEYQTVRLHLPDLVKTALVGRPDYKVARKRFETRYLAYRRSRNLLLPKLNFQGRVGYLGNGGTFNAANSEAFGFDLLNWEAGLVVEVPLGNRRAKGEVQKAKAELNKSQIALGDVEKQIVLEVRQAARDVATSLQRIASTKTSRDLTQQQLTNELERFKQGKSTNKIVLDYEEDLAREQLRYLQAVIAHKKALVGLSRSQGIIIQTHIGEQSPSRKYSKSKLGPKGGKASK